jgi:hypothetical protein
VADEAAGGAQSSEPAPVTDLDSALDRAFTETFGKDDDEGDAATADKGAGADRGTDGKFRKRDAGAEGAAADKGSGKEAGKDDAEPKRAPEGAGDAKDGKAGQDKAAADAPKGPVEPPQHWPEADKAMFRSQTPEAQAWLMQRHKAMEADNTRNSQTLASERKGFEATREYIKPFWPTLEQIEKEGQQRNFTVAQALDSFWTTYKALHKDPTTAISALAKQYGADLSKLTPGGGKPAEGGDDSYVDPQLKSRDDKIAALEKQINDLTGTFKGREEAEQAHLRTEASAEVSRMREAKSEDGQPLYPHFEEVRGKMSQIAAQGFVGSLAELYDEACWAVPTVRSKRLDAEADKRNSAAEAKRKADADAAEKARKEAVDKARKHGSTTFRSTAPGTGKAKAKSLDEALDMATEELGIG